MKLQLSSHKKLSTWLFLFTPWYTYIVGVACIGLRAEVHALSKYRLDTKLLRIHLFSVFTIKRTFGILIVDTDKCTLNYYLSHILALKEYSPEYRAVNLHVEALYPFPVFSKTLLNTVASLVWMKPEAANPWSTLAHHCKFASVINRVHIAWTQTGRHSMLTFTCLQVVLYLFVTETTLNDRTVSFKRGNNAGWFCNLEWPGVALRPYTAVSV